MAIAPPTAAPPARIRPLAAGALRASRACSAVLALALAQIAPAVDAAPPSKPPRTAEQEARETARSFGQQGFERLEKGDYQGALELFRKAEEHFHAPTHWLYIARSQAHLGRLLDAERSYKRVLSEDLAPRAPRAFVDARSAAGKEVEALRDRIPTVTVDVTGMPEGVSPEITLDGARVDAGPRGSEFRVDPGRHVIRVVAPGMTASEQALTIAEGESPRILVELKPARESGSVVPAAITLGLGAVGLGIGVVTGALSLSKVGDLDNRCPDRRCAPEDQVTADHARTLGTVSTVGFIAGGALAAAGVVLLVLRPSGDEPAAAAAQGKGPRVTVGAGPGAILVRGTF